MVRNASLVLGPVQASGQGASAWGDILPVFSWSSPGLHRGACWALFLLRPSALLRGHGAPCGGGSLPVLLGHTQIVKHSYSFVVSPVCEKSTELSSDTCILLSVCDTLKLHKVDYFSIVKMLFRLKAPWSLHHRNSLQHPQLLKLPIQGFSLSSWAGWRCCWGAGPLFGVVGVESHWLMCSYLASALAGLQSCRCLGSSQLGCQFLHKVLSRTQA
jgi:hypothetical protein